MPLIMIQTPLRKPALDSVPTGTNNVSGIVCALGTSFYLPTTNDFIFYLGLKVNGIHFSTPAMPFQHLTTPSE
jgi:hypothetical protein